MENISTHNHRKQTSLSTYKSPFEIEMDVQHGVICCKCYSELPKINGGYAGRPTKCEQCGGKLDYRKPPAQIFTKHCRMRFAERVLQISKSVDLEKYEFANRKSLNFEIKKRIAGSVVIDDSEIDSMLKSYLKTNYGDQSYIFYLNNNVIYVARKEEIPVIVTCYKRDGVIGAFHFAEFYNKYYHTGKLK